MQRRGVVLALGGLVGSWGCAAEETDASAPDPNACEIEDDDGDDGEPRSYGGHPLADDIVDPGDPQPGVIEVDTAWDKRTLRVCFTNNLYGAERIWVRQAIRESWEAVSGVRFTGWTTCANKLDGDITIELQDYGNGGSSQLGTHSLDAYPSMKITVDYEGSGCGNHTQCNEFVDDNGKTGRQNCIEEVAKHEFGHALGLRHEHAYTDSKCGDEDLDVPGQFDGQELWFYDEESVMNYCHLGSVDNAILSQGDVHTINSLYPGQVRLFTGTDFQGDSQSFAWGSWLECDMKQVDGDDVASIVVPPGMRARLCTDAVEPECETFIMSTNLAPPLLGNVGSIEVDARLHLYETDGFRGERFLYLEQGSHFDGLWWAVIEDVASSIIVPPGIGARLCTDESNGQGAGACMEQLGHHAMEFVLPAGHDDNTSFAEVHARVVSYTRAQYRDELFSYDFGTYRESDGSLPHPADIESFAIPYGMQVRACTDEGDGTGGGTCMRFRRSAPELPSALDNQIRFVAVETSDSLPSDFFCLPGFE
ncbi:MAG TPA: hypothetical protein VG755_21350 [Nannocystaceae bacterium]|nr:hypothetical protein [Nannocystaceae bacterium]